jgi:hypothetical protein
MRVDSGVGRRTTPPEVTRRTGMKTDRPERTLNRWLAAPGCAVRNGEDTELVPTDTGPTTESTASAAAGAATTRSIPQIARTVAR